MTLEYQDDFYINGYIKTKAKIITELTHNYRITWDMTKEYRKMINTIIFRHVYNECCKEEVERKRNKRYALNLLHYKRILPCEIIKFEINKF